AFAAVALLALIGHTRAAGPTAEDIEFFEKKIRPVLVEHCYQCHAAGAKKVRAGLRLDSKALVLQGGESGPALVPGDPSASLLLQALRYEKHEMPPNGKLPAPVIADFETWIKRGAADPRTEKVATPRSRIDFEAGRRFWSFQLPQRRSAPPVKAGPWV